jgi:hypothetical protein
MSDRLTNPNRAAYLDMEATGATADELWDCTGFVRCQDCHHLMRAGTLVTLPDHRCTQRQQTRRDVSA